jgi:hypothetical protein
VTEPRLLPTWVDAHVAPDHLCLLAEAAAAAGDGRHRLVILIEGDALDVRHPAPAPSVQRLHTSRRSSQSDNM